MATNSTLLASIWRGPLTLIAPIFPGTHTAFGPLPVTTVIFSLLIMTCVCSAAGHFMIKSGILIKLAHYFHPNLRDEVWDAPVTAHRSTDSEDGRPKLNPRKRTASELLFIVVHNALVALLAMLAWLSGSTSLALHAFTFEVAYEIFDTFNLGLARLEPETLIHHIVSPICILCSTQTSIDFRVLCHLCICIDLSGSLLSYSKFLLRYAHVSAIQVYRKLTWVYGIFRVALPLIDTVLIVWDTMQTRGNLFSWSIPEGGVLLSPRTDWTQLYFWAMAVLDTFNIYFFLSIRARSRLPSHTVDYYERMGCS